jgi:hypothetical protein
MAVNNFTIEVKEVLQEVITLKGGEKNAECRTCGYWQKLCYKPGEFVCGCHTSTQPS